MQHGLKLLERSDRTLPLHGALCWVRQAAMCKRCGLMLIRFFVCPPGHSKTACCASVSLCLIFKTRGLRVKGLG